MKNEPKRITLENVKVNKTKSRTAISFAYRGKAWKLDAKNTSNTRRKFKPIPLEESETLNNDIHKNTVSHILRQKFSLLDNKNNFAPN